MKFILLFLLLAVPLCNCYSHTGEEPRGPKLVLSDLDHFAPFNRALYLRFGISLPIGKFGGKVDPLASVTSSFQGTDNFGAKYGPMLEFGSIFYTDYQISEFIKPGIDATFFDISVNPVNWSNSGRVWEVNNPTSFVFVGTKIGPVVSYNPAGYMVVDLYYKINPVIVFPSSIEVPIGSSSYGCSVDTSPFL